MNIMVILLLLCFGVNSVYSLPLIVNETQKEYQAHKVMYGFIPYGRSIQGQMHFVNDLCTNSNSGKRIIITSFSVACNVRDQFRNAQDALAIVYATEGLNQILLLSDLYPEKGTIVNIQQKVIQALKKTPDSVITLQFPITVQTEKPLIEYIIYEVMQQTEVLNLVEEFKSNGFEFDFDLVYFTTQLENVYQVCYQKTLVIPADQENFIYLDGHKLDCKSEFEKKYVIVGDLGKTMTRRQILEENVRQICIKQIYGLQSWKSYRQGYVSQCQIHNEFNQVYECSKLLRQQLSIVEEYVDNCYITSFENNYQSHRILDKQLKLTNGLSTTHFRERATLVANGERIYGNYTFNTNKLFDPNTSSLFLGICQSYNENTRPLICNSITQTYCDWGCEVAEWVTWYRVLIVIIVLIIFSICLFIKYRFSQNQIDERRLTMIEIQEQEMTPQDIASEQIQQNGQTDVVFQQQNDKNKKIINLELYQELQEHK